jgi:hypothetical protein
MKSFPINANYLLLACNDSRLYNGLVRRIALDGVEVDAAFGENFS